MLLAPARIIGKKHPKRQRHTTSAPSSSRHRNNQLRHLLVEDHYRLDPTSKQLLPGVPAADDDWDRDLHDFFNLISLVPLVVLNILNWNWDTLLDPHNKKPLAESWTDEWFPLFFACTASYFVADLLWVTMVPNCVKSPEVIIQHHLATLLSLIVPYRSPADRWLMGACMSVEANTWLLIARRVFNKQGFGPWVIRLSWFSIRIKLISILFYVTWFGIRCALYPAIWREIWTLYVAQWKEDGCVVRSRYFTGLLIHSIFCMLNFKWTFDLLMSKWKALRSGKAAKVEKGL
eukprot:CAMPEP_0183718426 /NCGR_PEP_ID=MMETSP0737-20130205/11686_1 /TAXON_ID=385413 /ORGANISM="Thalassiosira miniscula, Strain CCMP1093" /LENGTH=289 /DNA_ID=CAMNT_0025947981 /DNA_START=674 /DNA_END=1544 /DNA_ORIENTATION=+